MVGFSRSARYGGVRSTKASQTGVRFFLKEKNMLTSTVDEAQAQLTQLIGLAERGGEAVIARAGKPIARIVPYCQAERPREGGQ